MSTADHHDGVPDQTNELNRPAGSDPIMREGHQPGLPVAPSDHTPEFHGKILPPGSAPKDQTFTPQSSDVPSQAGNPDMDPETETSAADTLGGATSADVQRGYGQPIQGQTSRELHHDGARGGDRERHGLAGLQSGVPSQNNPANPRVDEKQRGVDKDEATPGKGDKGAVGAEDLPPEKA